MGRLKRWLVKVLHKELEPYFPVVEKIVLKDCETTIFKNVEIVNNSFFKGNEDRVIKDVNARFAQTVIERAAKTYVEPVEHWEKAYDYEDSSKIITVIETVNRKK